MNEIRVLNLESYLPVYKIRNGEKIIKSIGFESELGRIKTNLQENINHYEENEINEIVNNDEEQENWLDQKIKLGEFGEKLALEYLKETNLDVKLVSDQAYLGYDIELNSIPKEGVEVKTSRKNLGFHITLNELKKAFEMKEKYNLFYIKIGDEDDAIMGYIINNPIEKLNINYKNLTTKSENNEINIIPNKFYISFKIKFLKTIQCINLEKYKKRITSL